MVSITLAVSEELKNEMDRFPEINWSAVARAAIERKIVLLKKFRELTGESELTEADAIRLGREMNMAIARRHKG